MNLNARQLALRRFVCWVWGHVPVRLSTVMRGETVSYGDHFCSRCKTVLAEVAPAETLTSLGWERVPKGWVGPPTKESRRLVHEQERAAS